MELFNLPNSTLVNRVIPKNAFDSYSTGKQKKLFTDLVAKITWTNKISPETTNLSAREINELQIFKIELKVKAEIQPLLDLIDKSIPYHIIFVVHHENSVYLSTSAKHVHPVKNDSAVLDWNFKTEWFPADENKYKINLKKSIDAIHHDFCIQLTGNPSLESISLPAVIDNQKKINSLKREIESLKNSIAGCKQFNKKVELNLKLKSTENKLKELYSA